MKLTLRNAPLRGIGMLVFNLLIFNTIYTQHASVCPIGVGMEPKSSSELKSTNYSNEVMMASYSRWTNTKNIKFSDDIKTDLVLDGIVRSRQLLGNNLKFQIPAGARINGIMLMVEGQSDNYKNIDELEILLLGRDGDPKGINKSNSAKLQNAWSKSSDAKDHSWMYGSATDTWGVNWTASEINDPDFGFQIQIRNIDNTPIKVSIDQISVLVNYTPAYSFCDDNCLTFYIDKYENYGSYVWEEVKGFRLVSKSFNHQTIDLKVNDAAFGLYNICVNVYDKKGKFAERCCRDFLYQDCNSSEIKGVAWTDLNDNNLRDGGEGVLINVPIVILDENNKPVDTVLTNEVGKYVFTMVMPGKYYLKVPEYADKKFVFKDNIDPDNNSDITGKNGAGTTDLINIEIGKVYENIDFGFKPLVSIGDFVWEDTNFNGLQDAGEQGISGMTVKLVRQDQTIADSVTTDSFGVFIFRNIPANRYFLQFTPGPDYRPTWKNTTQPTKNSKIDAAGKTILYTFNKSGSNFDIDAGFYKPVSLGDFVWEDINGDGIFNTIEPPLSNVRILLKGTAGSGQTIQLETTTNQDGKYYFNYLLPGTYTLTVVAPSGYLFTVSNIGDDDFDSDFVEGLIKNINLKSGEVITNFDAGFFRSGSIGNFVWNDENANGIQDPQEKGIPGVRVTLTEQLRDSIRTIGTIITDLQGNFLFDKLKPGNYKILFAKPEGFFATKENLGSDDEVDSDASDNCIIGIQVKSGQSNNSYDAGFFRVSSIGDFVWEDSNANGIQDVGEKGIEAIKINLKGIDGLGRSISLDTQSNITGLYIFGNLTPGSYSLQIDSIPSNYKFTKTDIGLNDQVDSDADLGFIPGISLSGGTNDKSYDIGLVKNIEIGDFIWEDKNSNGIQDPGEPGIAGIQIRLTGTAFDGVRVDLTATSDTNGKYTFKKIFPGSYSMSVEVPAGYCATKSMAGNDSQKDSNLSENENSVKVELRNSIDDFSYDIGLLLLSSIGDLVYEDLNCDGIRQDFEPGIEGVRVNIEGLDIFNSIIQKSVVTNTNGNYLFGGLKPGMYTVTFMVPTGYEFATALVNKLNLSSGQNTLNVDAPFFRRASLGDFVWSDTNSNGIQDASEAGISGVTVKLKSLSAPQITEQQTTTNTNGIYTFGNLKPGTYQISFGAIADNKFTAVKAGTDGTKDSDADDKGIVADIALISGATKTDIDAGYVSTATASIGDFVWEDLNGNGIQDAGEPGLAGVKISIIGQSVSGKTIVKSTTSSAVGSYIFDSLPNGSYQVTFEKPSGYNFSDQGLGTADNGSDADIITGQTAPIILQVGQIVTNIDAGMYRLASLGDFVWSDTNSNGIQDASEIGISGVIVKLKGLSTPQTAEQQTTTNTNGIYTFGNLKPGTYQISFGAIADNKFTAEKAGTDGTKDSDADDKGIVVDIALISGATKTDIDAGYVSTATASIGDFVWEDLNGNGIQDAGEPGLAGVKISINGQSVSGKTIVRSTTSSAVGSYIFDSLPNGSYQVSFEKPSGYNFSDQGLGTADNGSDADIITGQTAPIILQVGQIVTNIDAGMYRLASLGDFVWSDTNSNGIQDANETGISAVTVKLKSLSAPQITEQQTTTNTNGIYTFENLKPGTYQISFGTVADNKFTTTKSGSDGTKDSDADDKGIVANIDVISGATKTDIDAGYVSTATASIGDFVWEDLNGNGIQDAGEPGLAGVKISINGQSVSGKTIVRSTTSSAVGSYIFDSLPNGSYQVTFEKPSGYNFSDQGLGTADNGSDADIITGQTAPIILQVGQIVTNIDAGMYRLASLGDFVWSDTNSNGIQDASEIGISGVTVKLMSLSAPQTAEQQTTTNTNGIYIFENLKPGTYQISFGAVADNKFTTAKAGTDGTKDSDADDKGIVVDIALISGATKTDIDAGYVSTATASIGDFVWEDLNGNGIQDAGEPGITNVKITLKGESPSVSTVLLSSNTDLAGRYLFSNLAPGSYSISIEKPTGFLVTDADKGSDDVDSDIDPTTAKSAIIVLLTAQRITNIDAGLFRYGSIGDFVWNDLNENGLQDNGEPGITGVKMILKNQSGSEISSLTTGNFGFYFFANVRPGIYNIEAEIPAGLKLTQTINSNNTLNSDYTLSNGKAISTPITIRSNEMNFDIDLGLVAEKGSIAGIAWKDTNGNGIRETAEAVFDSVKVYLLNVNGDTIQLDTTDANGVFAFKNLNAAGYFVRFEKQPNLFFTYSNRGSDPLFDSDVIDLNGKTGQINLSGGENRNGINAGFVNPSAIGDFVWIDSNKDGFQDSGENGLNGVKIRLLNAGGIVLDSVTSTMKNGKGGYYSFGNLIYGSYTIEFSLPANFEYTKNINSDTLKNSDVADIKTGNTQTIALSPGVMRDDIDAGFILMAPVAGKIQGLVWQDANNNKIRDLNEAVLSGVTVSLFALNGTLIGTQTSANDGSYSFNNVPFGDYYIRVPEVTDKQFVLFSGTQLPDDSDITNDFGPGSTRILNVLPGVTLSNIDLGYFQKISIGDFVWDDLNNNGLQDLNESGVANITVTLINEKGAIEKTTMSDATGKYTFTNIATGKYRLKFSMLTGFVFAMNNSSDQNKNSKADPNTGETILLDFSLQQTYTNIDAGYVKTGSVGDRVWLDLNGNGFFQAGEPGILNVKVKLFTSSGVLIDSTITANEPGGDFTGYYKIENIRPGSYFIKFEIPSNYLISPSGVGGDDFDSNISEENGPKTTGIFMVSAGQFVNNIDAAAYLPASIGDRVWNDTNKNGLQDSGEPGVAGISVKLFTQSGQLLSSTTTNSQGNYIFSNLRQRLYYLQFSIPDGLEFTLQNAAGSSMNDSDVDATGTTPLISLAHGSVLLDIDAGMHSTNARLIMGNIWNDINKNGIRTEDEKLQSGIKVHLKDLSQGTVKTVVTNHAGMYALSTTKAGEHVVVVESPDNHVFTEKRVGVLPDFDSDVDENGESDMVMFDDKYKMKYVDAGFYYKVITSINGMVWKDTNKNGVKDDKDLPMSNVVIFLFNQSRIFVKSTKSNDKGEYSLKNLDAGQYYCKLPEFPDLDFVMFTGTNQDKDSEITNQYGPGTSRLLTIQAGVPFANFDFGYRDLNRFTEPDPKRESVFGIYPNPAVNEVRVKIPSDPELITEYYIVNNQGSIVKKGRVEPKNEILNIEYLPAGRYTIHFVNSQEKIMKSFVKIDN